MQDGKALNFSSARTSACGLLRAVVLAGAFVAGSALASLAAASDMVYASEAGPLRVTEVARGLVNYDAEQALLLIGKTTRRIEELLGQVDDPELVHRDNLVLV